MNRAHRILLVALIAVLALSVAIPAGATESPSDGGAETTTTVAAEPVFVEGDEPAVIVPVQQELDKVEHPWTARFIYPTIVVATILLLIGLAIGYNRSIRRKYTVVS